ncbi:hypothetical protein K439DRAFT_1383673 [Ramaria rubella]|nr:hypothetical protein K439DRAFT_1383673 [Ramaria rubella]
MSMSLPTPPRTTHKDKENQPPTPLTPSNSSFRTPRIVWSQENLHHAYTTQIRQLPSSSSARGPHKSILKKPSLPLMSIIPPEASMREVTPEPADPLHHPLYLNSPVSTLVVSLRPEMHAKITLTDLTEAYSVLSARLKTKTHAMLDMCGPIPALEPLREHSSELVAAFHRDISRALVDPQSSPPPPSNDSPWSTPSSVGSIKKRGFTEQEVKHARDLCNLSHAAMRCFSNISVVPVLTSIFNDIQLGEILTDVLAIPLATSLPTPNARKTCQIAVWTLQVQRLPTAVLAPAADRIAYALRRGIDGELGREGKKGAASDALKAVATLALYQPTVFVSSFAEIIPSVLANITSSNLTLRMQAAHAVISVSRALSHLPDPPASLQTTLSEATTSYLVQQHKSRRTPQELSPLGKAFDMCLSAETPSHSAHSPMWALTVIAAFIVLSGGEALTHSKTLKFVLGHLQTAMLVKRTTVRATAGLVWRALIWACVQLDNGQETEEKKDAGWRIVRQIVDGAIGISIVAALTRQRHSNKKRVPQALEVVSAMIKKGGKTCEEAVDILERLLCGVGSGIEELKEENWVNEKLLSEPLYDGTLLQGDWKNLALHVKDGLNQSVTIVDVRRLQEDEVIEHWDALFAIWREAVERAPLGDDGDVPPPLLSAWQALLLTQTQLTQGYEHLSSEPAFISQLSHLLKSFLADQSLEWSLDATAPSWSSQPLKLGFVRNLWIVARNVFAVSTLANAAELLLSEVLKHDYHTEQNEVRDAWAALCAELLLAGEPRLVRELWGEDEQGYGLKSALKRGLWRVVSHQWIEQAGAWTGAIELLRAPFALPIEWEFDHDDLDLWVRLLDCALLVASTRKVSSNTVLDIVANEIGIGHNYRSLYAVLPFLLFAVDSSAPERTSISQLPYGLLKLTNDVLVASYPPEDAGSKPMLLAVMESLAEVVKNTYTEVLVDLLTLIQEGTGSWVSDMKDVFTDDEFNQRVIPIYITALDVLKKTTPSSTTLHALTPFLISAFNRIPEPAAGPTAFKNFWSGTYMLLDSSEIDYPEDLKPVLRNVQEAMCASDEVFAPGLSQDTETQDLETADLVLSIVPDSLEGNKKEHDEIANTDPGHEIQPLQFAEVEEAEDSRCKALVLEACNPVYDADHSGHDHDHERVLNFLVLPPSPTSLSPDRLPDLKVADLTSSAPILSLEQHDHIGALSLVAQPPTPASSQNVQGNPELSGVLVVNPSFPVSSDHSRIEDIPTIKSESQEVNFPGGSQSLRIASSSLGKRRRSRLFSHSSKKRKSGPSAGVEIINVSDDEDSELVALNTSIVVTRTKCKKAGNEKAPGSQQTGILSIPRSEPPTTMTAPIYCGNKKRTLFEAVEIPRVVGLHIHGSPVKRRKITKTRSGSGIHDNRNSDGDAVEIPDNSKCRGIEFLMKDFTDDWKDVSPSQNVVSHADVFDTPLRPSDISIPTSQPGKISASHIISPLPRRSRSQAYDPPSDDNPMSSSPLKHAAERRRLHRAQTLPAIPIKTLSDVSDSPTRPSMTRSPSEEFLALEHAHEAITSGASKMGLHELLEASRIANGISAALNNQVAKKFSSPGAQAGPA